MATFEKGGAVSEAVCKSHDADGNVKPDWLAARRGGVTATDAAKLLSGGSWMALWARKTGRIEPEDLSRVERVWWGSHLESKIIEAYASERYTGRRVYPSGELVRSEEFPHLMATLDARTEHPEHGLIPLEVKNADRMMEDRWSDGPPEIYAWQARTQAVVEDTVASSIACALGGNRLLWADDEQTAANVNRIIEVTTRFWWHVTNDVPPEKMDGLPETKKALDATFLPTEGTIALGIDFAEMDIEYAALKAEMAKRNQENKNLKRRLDSIEAQIKRAMGNNTHGTLPTGVVWNLKRVERREHLVRASSSNRLTRKAPR
jgi:predicted phage-related endonuclease